VDEDEIEGHTDADDGEDEAEDDGVAVDFAGLPGAGAELVNELDVTEDSAEINNDAEGDESDSGPEGEPGGAGSEMRFCGCELAEEEAETADGEANSHEAEAGANPGEKGSLGGEVDSGVLFGRLIDGIHGGNCKG
jgi:hypothetical protein